MYKNSHCPCTSNLEIMIMGVIELINFLNLIIVKELVNIKI